MTSAATIERAILRDREQRLVRKVVTQDCFLCGRSFSRARAENGRFCSQRCQDFYDAGECRREIDPYDMQIGSKGFWTECADCKRRFESLGLRYCSQKCKENGAQKREIAATMAEVGMDSPQAKTCEDCGRRIPKWVNGRRVRKDRRFCSDRCAKRAA